MNAAVLGQSVEVVEVDKKPQGGAVLGLSAETSDWRHPSGRARQPGSAEPNRVGRLLCVVSDRLKAATFQLAGEPFAGEPERGAVRARAAPLAARFR